MNSVAEVPQIARPILFGGEMVRAILDGRKTQTRRIVKPQPNGESVMHCNYGGGWSEALRCPYGVAGDRLWVRETFALHDDRKPSIVYYRADDQTAYESDGAWKPSIYMPRWASRITLEITKVRVERLQDITAKDIEAEGFPYEGSWHDGARVRWYHHLWDSLHGEGAWEKNPWVWVLEFKPRLSENVTESDTGSDNPKSVS